jgi:hypothetical protein
LASAVVWYSTIYEMWDFILFNKALANPNYIPVYMTVNYLFTLCLFNVGVLFYKLAIPKYTCVFVNMLSKENKYVMFGWTWEIEHKMYCLLLTWAFVCDSVRYFYSSVSNVYFVLWKCVCVGSRNIPYMPRCRFNVLNVHNHRIYLLLVARNILKYISLLFIFLVLRHIALLVASLVAARNWSLAWAW